jgi:hypothetical protein
VTPSELVWHPICGMTHPQWPVIKLTQQYVPLPDPPSPIGTEVDDWH